MPIQGAGEPLADGAVAPMNTPTGLAMLPNSQWQTALPVGDAEAVVLLPPPRLTGGMALTAALAARQSCRSFSPEALSAQTLSDLLWAAAGINRQAEGGRTAPSALNAQEMFLYVALPQGLYLYEPKHHELALMVPSDVRRAAGHQDFADAAPLDLVYVADHGRLKRVPASQREAYAFAAAGAMVQNVYLHCAAEGLATVVRAWFDCDALSQAMGVAPHHQVLLVQTVGRVGASASAKSTPLR